MLDKFMLAVGFSVAVGAYLLGFDSGSTLVQKEFAEYREQVQAAQVVLAREMLGTYAEWQQVGNLMTDELEATRQELLTVKEEKQRVIYKTKTVTVDRPCLGADAVRLLNGSRTGLQLSDAAGGTASDNATGIASDTDVAVWAADAQQRYAECSARLMTLIDWHRLARGM